MTIGIRQLFLDNGRRTLCPMNLLGIDLLETVKIGGVRLYSDNNKAHTLFGLFVR